MYVYIFWKEKSLQKKSVNNEETTTKKRCKIIKKKKFIFLWEFMERENIFKWQFVFRFFFFQKFWLFGKFTYDFVYVWNMSIRVFFFSYFVKCIFDIRFDYIDIDTQITMDIRQIELDTITTTTKWKKNTHKKVLSQILKTKQNKNWLIISTWWQQQL